MTAVVLIQTGDVCMATKEAVPYTECTCGHQHVFADPSREGQLLAGWATLHPKPAKPGRPYTMPLPGQAS